MRILVLVCLSLSLSALAATPAFEPRGIGGGGALAGFSISPYADLRFVGTDMGTLFRSTDGGKHWQGVAQRQTRFGSDLSKAATLGFSADGRTVFHAAGGVAPQRSLDAGVTWKAMRLPLEKDEVIRYWESDPRDASFILCATTRRLWVSTDKGGTWAHVRGAEGLSLGTVLLHPEPRERLIYHATSVGISRSVTIKPRFEAWYAPPGGIHLRAFAGGADSAGTTLAFIDDQGHRACAWADGDAGTEKSCGFVWIAKQDGAEAPAFRMTSKEGGDFVRMAENDSRVLYVTGGNWIRAYGSKIWVSLDRGKTWDLRLHLYDWDKRPYAPWPSSKLEHSAVGLDVGWDDNAYYGFAVNPANSAEAGGTGNYFLHTTRDLGQTWQAPFTAYADTGEKARQKRWRSTGLEVTSVLKLKFNPSNPKLGYAAMADLGGLVTEDGGLTWRISKAHYNTNYDYAFDASHPDWIYAASGAYHDFPIGQNAPFVGEGGVYRSQDRGRTWTRLTPASGPWNRQFLSVAYDPVHHAIYGGTQGGGVARSSDGGETWSEFDTGLPSGERIIPQIEIDPKTGDTYALLAGAAPDYANHAATGIYRLKGNHWVLLRGSVARPAGVDAKYDLWRFPIAFAVDFAHHSRLWLADFETPGTWLATGVWVSDDGGESWRRTTQFTHPMSLTLDRHGRGRLYVSGPWDPNWGKGGVMVSTDGGETWRSQEKLPFAFTPDGVTPDPAHFDKAFYLFFGNGMLYGDALGH